MSVLLERSVALCDCIILTVTLVRCSGHNLRYIKNQLNPGMPLMPLILSCSRGSCLFIIGGSRVHVCICALHAAQLHLNIYSLHALKRSMADERSRFNSKCVTFCITGTVTSSCYRLAAGSTFLIQASQKIFIFHLGSNDLFPMIHFLTLSKLCFVNI